MTTFSPRSEQVSAERLRECVDYCPETGVFTWKELAASSCYERTRNTRHSGKPAGGPTRFGYWRVYIDRVAYQGHRLAWLHVHGEWPQGDLDHIDRNRLNNAIANLRPASRAQNNANSTIRRDNKSGVKGVGWDKKKKQWIARIHSGGKTVFLGYFRDLELAKTAYSTAAQSAFGPFASAGETA